MLKRGITVVFAVLLVTVVLAVSFVLFNITIRQIILTLVARDSRIAFYAADRALNCALYWDRQAWLEPPKYPFGYYSLRDPGPPPIYDWHPPDGKTPTCGGELVDNWSPASSRPPYISTFTSFFEPAAGGLTPCAKVEVKKNLVNGPPKTVITVRGYNVSKESPNDECPGPETGRVVEREIVTQ